jgi:hypothetical protein
MCAADGSSGLMCVLDQLGRCCILVSAGFEVMFGCICVFGISEACTAIRKLKTAWRTNFLEAASACADQVQGT